MRFTHSRRLPSMFAGFLISVSGAAAFAQTADDDAKKKDSKEEVTELTAMVITGSNIPTAADATTVPVTILGSRDIEQLGIDTNMLEILHKKLPMDAGRNNIGLSNASTTAQTTFGGSSLSLRNLDTLILINGRRVAANGANGIRGKNFVDVGQIPAAAIERVEVLTDGASAIYGSDAVGGVVNFILKNDYHGAEIGGRYAIASGDGHYTERSGHIVVGGGEHGVNVTVSGSWSKIAPLFQKDRPFSHVITGRTAIVPGAVGQGASFPTAFLNPSLNSPSQTNPVGTKASATSLNNLIANGTYAPATSASVSSTYDTAPYTTLLIGQTQKSALISATAELFGKKLAAFGDAIVAQTNGFWQIPAQTNTVTEPTQAPYNPLTVAFPQVGLAYLPAPLEYNTEARSIWASGGLRGEIGANWNWEASYTYNKNSISQFEHNVYYKPNLVRALAGGYDAQGNAVAGGAYSKLITGYSESSGTFVVQPALDPFARAPAVNPRAFDNLLGTALLRVGAKLGSFDASVSGTPLELPAGKLGVAFGVGSRVEEISGNPDRNSLTSDPAGQNWIGGSFFDPFDQSRRVKSAFGELRVPVAGAGWNLPGIHVLDLTAAYRIEDYSDVGRSKVPKYGFRWQPIDDQMTVRCTYSKSFTAPGLYFISGPSNQAPLAANTLKTALGFTGQPQNFTTANPNLKPATATAKAMGVVVSPRAVKGLTVSVDYVNVEQKGVAGGPGAGVILTSVDQFGPQSPYIGNIAFNNFPGRTGAVAISSPGQLTSFLKAGGNPGNIYLTSNFINLSGAKVKAFDLSLEYERPVEGFGTFTFTTAGTYFETYKFQALPGQPFYEYAGYATSGGTGQQGTLPRYRLYSVIEWSWREYGITVANTYVPHVTDIGVGGDTFAHSTTATPRPVGYYTAWDLQFSYTVGARAARGVASWLRGMKLTLGVNNVFDRMPPAAPQAFSDSGVDTAAYSVIGRLFFVSGNLKF